MGRGEREGRKRPLLPSFLFLALAPIFQAGVCSNCERVGARQDKGNRQEEFETLTVSEQEKPYKKLRTDLERLVNTLVLLY